jgi:hypothetical protein
VNWAGRCACPCTVGAGGWVGFGDPDTGLAFGYVTSQLGPRWRNPRNQALMDGSYAGL